MFERLKSEPTRISVRAIGSVQVYALTYKIGILIFFGSVGSAGSGLVYARLNGEIAARGGRKSRAAGRHVTKDGTTSYIIKR